MPNDEIVMKKTLSYAGERWRAFKHSLTRRYLFGGVLSHKSPIEKYDFITPDVWQAFANTRDSPSFLVSLFYYLVDQLNLFSVA